MSIDTNSRPNDTYLGGEWLKAQWGHLSDSETVAKEVDRLYRKGSGDGSFINVKNYGAKGNGIADDTNAINDALNAIAESTNESGQNHGYLYFPAGKYLFSSQIKTGNRPGLKIIGDGIARTDGQKSATRLCFTGSGYDPAIKVGQDTNHARVTSPNAGPYSMTNGEVLEFTVSDLTGSDVATVTFDQGGGGSYDPADITAVTADEAAALIRAAGDGRYDVEVTSDSKIEIISRFKADSVADASISFDDGNTTATAFGFTSANNVTEDGGTQQNEGKNITFQSLEVCYSNSSFAGPLVWLDGTDHHFFDVAFRWDVEQLSAASNYHNYSAIGVRFNSAKYTVFERCYFDHAKYHLYAPNLPSNGFIDGVFRDCQFIVASKATGLLLDSGGGGARFDHCVFNWTRTPNGFVSGPEGGLYMTGNGWSVRDCVFGTSGGSNESPQYFMLRAIGRGSVTGNLISQSDNKVAVSGKYFGDFSGNKIGGNTQLSGNISGGGNIYTAPAGVATNTVTACDLGLGIPNARDNKTWDDNSRTWTTASGVGSSFRLVGDTFEAASNTNSWQYSYRVASVNTIVGEVLVDPFEDQSVMGPKWDASNARVTIKSLGQKIIDKTSNYTILPGENGTWFTNKGASGAVAFTLPGGTHRGFEVQFAVYAANALSVIPAGDDAIWLGGESYSTNIVSSDSGAFVSLQCDGDGNWLVKSRDGTIAGN